MNGQSDEMAPCCAPTRTAGTTRRLDVVPLISETRDVDIVSAPVSGPRVQNGLVNVTGGEFLMGTDDPAGFPADGEGPVRRVTVRPFRIARHAVTNDQFAAFVAATGYTTEAERFGWSFVFHLLIEGRRGLTVKGTSGPAPWWLGVADACWLAPEGTGSTLEGRGDHPVVHVSWNDARAYCAWASVRLPTEAEWERAARGGLEQKRYPWGNELTPDKKHRCNIWQGQFPTRNTTEDGFLGTAPVTAYRPNGYGLYNVAGNVWEWCADWFSATYHVEGPRENPIGPPDGNSRVVRGGSYLCHRSYCNRYRVGARSGNTPDSSTGNTGFRVAADA